MKAQPLIAAIVTGVVVGVTVDVAHELRERTSSGLKEKPDYKVRGPLASVVIPALEEENYLENLLTSVQNSTYEPTEIIVADSSPPESYQMTQEICRQYRAKCIHVPELGVAYARNEGAKEAKGDILIFSDADNVLEPRCIESLVETLEEGYIIANPVECVIDDGIVAFGAVWGRNWFKGNRTTRCVAIWKEAFWQIGGYDSSCDPMQGCREDLKLGQDITERFGPGSIKLVREALIGSSARRERAQGIEMWKSRGVRNHIIEY